MKWQVPSRKWQVKIGSLLGRALSVLTIVVGLGAAPVSMSFAQDTPIPRDDALDSLLEKLSESSDRSDRKAEKPSSKEGRDGKKTNDAAKAKDSGGGSSHAKGAGATGAKDGKAPAAKADGSKSKKSNGSRSLTGKDQEVDELLQKLGETTDTPSPDDRPRGGAGAGEKSEGQGPSQRPDQPDRSRLTGKDKETDEHLEELTGRRRRRRQDDGERSGPAGQIIKEMRDIEQRLNKPDTGDGTREEQKKVVKQIETLIQEMKQSGQSSMRGVALRRRQRQGRQPGQQQPGTEGAMARGAPLSKPSKPPTRHSNAGGKDIWGHLPPELRQLIENTFAEQPLSTKQELIDRYYISVNKGKLVREETP